MSSKSQQSKLHWTLFKNNRSSSSSVVPIAEKIANTVTEESSSTVPNAENNSIAKRSTLKKTAEEKVVQLLSKGVWVLRRIAANVCEVTFVNRTEDKGDIPVEFVNMGVTR